MENWYGRWARGWLQGDTVHTFFALVGDCGYLDWMRIGPLLLERSYGSIYGSPLKTGAAYLYFFSFYSNFFPFLGCPDTFVRIKKLKN